MFITLVPAGKSGNWSTCVEMKLVATTISTVKNVKQTFIEFSVCKSISNPCNLCSLYNLYLLWSATRSGFEGLDPDQALKLPNWRYGDYHKTSHQAEERSSYEQKLFSGFSQKHKNELKLFFSSEIFLSPPFEYSRLTASWRYVNRSPTWNKGTVSFEPFSLWRPSSKSSECNFFSNSS